MNGTTKTPSTFLRVTSGQDCQTITVLGIGRTSAVCTIETRHLDGTLTLEGITSIQLEGIPLSIKLQRGLPRL